MLVVQAVSLTSAALQNWIVTELKKQAIHHAPQVPALIHQYAQGNMLACAQVIEKLALIANKDKALSIDEVMEQLIDQCDYQLYELTDACLSANANKAIHLLRRAALDQAEPTLILWLLAQEIRQLMQLSYLLKQSETLATACKKLKIWPQRISLYQNAVDRLSILQLQQILKTSQRLDEQIKSNQNQQVWHSLEQLALSLCGYHA